MLIKCLIQILNHETLLRISSGENLFSYVCPPPIFLHVNVSFTNMSLTLSDPSSGSHLDLMEVIGVPLSPSVSLTSGYEGFQAYNFGPEANIGRLTKTFVPGSFSRDFAIIVTVSQYNIHLKMQKKKMLYYFEYVHSLFNASLTHSFSLYTMLKL